MNKILFLTVLLVLALWGAAQSANVSVYYVYRPGDAAGIWHRLIGFNATRGDIHLNWVFANESYGLGECFKDSIGPIGHRRAWVYWGRPYRGDDPWSIPRVTHDQGWYWAVVPYWLLALPPALLLARRWARHLLRKRIGFAVQPVVGKTQ